MVDRQYNIKTKRISAGHYLYTIHRFGNTKQAVYQCELRKDSEGGWWLYGPTWEHGPFKRMGIPYQMAILYLKDKFEKHNHG